MPAPPRSEADIGMGSYLTQQPGVGGRLRVEPEDFVVVELGAGPAPGEGPFTAARIRLRNWETNRFAGIAARRIGIKPGAVGFAGMKDKRAVTEQWFTFKAPEAKVLRLQDLDDVELLELRATTQKQYAGAHAGNRFVVRVREARTGPDAVEAVQAAAETVRHEGGVPAFFGPQRFGSSFRAITHRVGAAIVAGDLEEAVRLYLGEPMETEREEARQARTVYEETRDPEATLAVMPERLDPERRMLERLVRRPDDWRYAMRALPGNLLQLFVHAHQSWAFNHVVSARLAAGWRLGDVQIGDRVMGFEDDGTHTHLVTSWNLDRVRREIAQGRAAATAPLPGMDTPLASGGPGALEQEVLDRLGIRSHDFACPELPDVASDGRRRVVLQRVQDLQVAWEDGDPVFAFALGKGEYATTVLREFMKAEADVY